MALFVAVLWTPFPCNERIVHRFELGEYGDFCYKQDKEFVFFFLFSFFFSFLFLRQGVPERNFSAQTVCSMRVVTMIGSCPLGKQHVVGAVSPRETWLAAVDSKHGSWQAVF